jgi:serine/threonine protein kinase
LKSSVVRLDSRGIAKLVDFSLAIMQKSPHMQSTLDDGNIVGTPGFISPEQVQGVEHLTTQ